MAEQIIIPEGMDGIVFNEDNADVMPGINSNSLDGVICDPPFCTQRSRLNKEGIGYIDGWYWDESKHRPFLEELKVSHPETHCVISGFLYNNTRPVINKVAYLCDMADFLLHVKRANKETANATMHCDWRVNSHLRLLMDAVFGHNNFRSEITWERNTGGGSNSSTRNLAVCKESILWYSTDPKLYYYNQDAVTEPYDMDNLPEKTAKKYCNYDKDGRRYRLDNLNAPEANPDNPNLHYELMGVTRTWRWTKERMEQAVDEGLVVQTKPGGVPQLVRYLDEQKGLVRGDLWTHIKLLNSQAKERAQWKDQKPVELYELLLDLLVPPSGTVLDGFFGSGTTGIAAQKTGRRFIGIDRSDDAIAKVSRRLRGYTKEQRDKALAQDPDWEERVLANRKFALADKLPERTDDLEEVEIPKLGLVIRHKEQLGIPVDQQMPMMLDWLKVNGFDRGQCCGCLDVAIEGPGLPSIEEQRHNDHREPRKIAGDALHNRAPLCPACNQLKKNELTLEAVRIKRFGSTKKAEDMHPIKREHLKAMSVWGREEDFKALQAKRYPLFT